MDEEQFEVNMKMIYPKGFRLFGEGEVFFDDPCDPASPPGGKKVTGYGITADDKLALFDGTGRVFCRSLSMVYDDLETRDLESDEAVLELRLKVRVSFSDAKNASAKQRAVDFRKDVVRLLPKRPIVLG